MSKSTVRGKGETVSQTAEVKRSSQGAPLEGKAAIVTGGGRGMGRSMVLGLARAGAKVIATAARERQELDRVVAEAPRDAVVPMIADVTNVQDCAALVAETLQRFGKLDVLVNNAGRGMKYVSEDFITEPTRFWETDPETWRLIIDTNVNGPFLMARAAVPSMISAGWGRIINHSVNFLTMQRRGFSPYGPSKAALESETQIWAQELAGTGVTVNAILPGGATLTGMIPESYPEAARKQLLDPDIVVAPLLYLASEASDGITGKRFDSSKWNADLPVEEAGLLCARDAGVYQFEREATQKG
ncbi:MAG: SDR family oxidoreductase [Deltaproteobacteria bacterium]|nr:SDR family oxidoreductase [Deltaproteobacteria bacterium]